MVFFSPCMVSTISFLGINGADPLLFPYHRIDQRHGEHPLLILDGRYLELLLQCFPFLRFRFLKIGLLYVEHIVCLQKRRDLIFLLLVFIQVLIYVERYFLSVLVSY